MEYDYGLGELTDNDVRLAHLVEYEKRGSQIPVEKLKMLEQADFVRIGALAIAAPDVTEQTVFKLKEMNETKPLPALLVAGKKTLLVGNLDLDDLFEGALIDTRCGFGPDTIKLSGVFVELKDCEVSSSDLEDVSATNSQITNSGLRLCNINDAKVADSKLRTTDMSDGIFECLHGSAGQEITGRIINADLAHTISGQVIVTNNR